MQRFVGKRIIVTGAASGIGQGTVLRLLREGGSVAAIDVDETGLASTRETATEEGMGDRVSIHTLDVSSETDVDSTVDEILASLGGLDVLVNAAGILRAGHTHEFSYETFNRLMAINMGGTFLMTKKCVPVLVENGGGCIVNFGSTSAAFAHPYMAAYAATKGAIVSFTHSVALEYHKQGVRCVAVCPGGIQSGITDYTAGAIPSDADWTLFNKIQPLAGFGVPENIASVIAMLASDDGRFVNGTEVRVDGGAHC